MGKYTISDDPSVDQAVQDIVNVIVKSVLRLMGDYVQAIVLIGGYGRGEGGIYKSKNGYRLVNDLDILVFVGKHYCHCKNKYTPLLEEMADDLLPEAKGLKQIDIVVTNSWMCRFVPNLVFYYEMKNGYKIIYGAINLSEIMPHFEANNLPLFDGHNYFLNRGSGLLLAAMYFLTSNLDKTKIRENFQIEIQKACLAMGDALLLISKRYHYSYRERLHRIKTFQCSGVVPEHILKMVKELYCWGCERKLNPTFKWTSNEEMIKQWFNVRNTFGEFFLWFESTRLNMNFQDWGNYSNNIHKNGVRAPWDVKLWNFLIRIKAVIAQFYKVAFRKNQAKSNRKKTAVLSSVMPLLLFSLKEDVSFDHDLMSQAFDLLEISSENIDASAWIMATKKYLSIWHPAGIVQEAMCLETKQSMPSSGS